MGDIIGYIMAAQFLQERGDFEQGSKIFENKQCGRCHDSAASGAPPREKMSGRMSSFGIIAAVSRHGPAMLEKMQRAGYSWPYVTALEMADLTTYLHGLTLKRRAPLTSDKDGRGAK
jgi:mono/diheme cytochrome c family protein